MRHPNPKSADLKDWNDNDNTTQQFLHILSTSLGQPQASARLRLLRVDVCKVLCVTLSELMSLTCWFSHPSSCQVWPPPLAALLRSWREVTARLARCDLCCSPHPAEAAGRTPPPHGVGNTAPNSGLSPTLRIRLPHETGFGPNESGAVEQSLTIESRNSPQGGNSINVQKSY